MVFVVDSSDGVGQSNYQKELELVKQTVDKMNIGARGVHVGMVTYGSKSQPAFNLKVRLHSMIFKETTKN